LDRTAGPEGMRFSRICPCGRYDRRAAKLNFSINLFAPNFAFCSAALGAGTTQKGLLLASCIGRSWMLFGG
jgi:hypothetical protein